MKTNIQLRLSIGERCERGLQNSCGSVTNTQFARPLLCRSSCNTAQLQKGHWAKKDCTCTQLKVAQKQPHELRIPHTKSSTPEATSGVQKQHQEMKENHTYFSKPRAQNTTDKAFCTKGNISGTEIVPVDERQSHIFQNQELKIPQTKTSTPKAISVVQIKQQEMKENHTCISKPGQRPNG